MRAVIIRSKHEHKKSEDFYQSIRKLLESEGFDVQFDDGEPNTVPNEAELWVGHSTGARRLRFAPDDTHTVALGTKQGISHPMDRAAKRGGRPNWSHFSLTKKMRDAICEEVQEIKNGEKKSASLSKTAIEKKEDDELVDMWRSKKHKPAYDELKNRHDGMVYQKTNQYRASPVPQPAIEAEGWKQFDDAVETYDPNKGAQFSTHLNYRLRKVDRFNKKHQNIGRIPESRAGRIGDYQRAKEKLEHELGRQPSSEEIAEEAGMDEKEIDRLEGELRQDLYEGKYEGEQLHDSSDARGEQVLRDMRHELSGQEREVYDHLMGYGGKEKVDSKQELARKMDISPGRISQISSSISSKIKPHLSRV